MSCPWGHNGDLRSHCVHFSGLTWRIQTREQPSAHGEGPWWLTEKAPQSDLGSEGNAPQRPRQLLQSCTELGLEDRRGSEEGNQILIPYSSFLPILLSHEVHFTASISFVGGKCRLEGKEHCGGSIGLWMPSLASSFPCLSHSCTLILLFPSCFKYTCPSLIQVLLINVSWGFFKSGFHDDNRVFCF